MSELLDSIYNQAKKATEELCEKAKLKQGNIFMIILMSFLSLRLVDHLPQLLIILLRILWL